jgi:hypothetical protein
MSMLAASEVEKRDPRDTWKNNAKFFVGARSGVGFSPGGQGPSPTFGLEVGIANRSGIGFGLHVLGSTNPQALPALNIPKAGYVFGGAADLRIYIQTVNPLTLYPSFSLGFLTGPALVGGTNVVLPMFNLGFGARMRFGPVYAALELGLASFHIPFVSIALGYESKPRFEPPDDDPVITDEHEEEAEAAPAPAPPPMVKRRPQPPPPPPAAPEAEWATPQ